MLSTFPADCLLGNPFEPGFPSWDTPFLFHMEDEPAVFSQEPVTSNSGSDTLNPTPCSGSDDSNRNEPRTFTSGSGSGSGSGSDDENRDKIKDKRLGCDVDERKRRRMLSNRESARRSRKRKQKHLENLRNQANRLMVGNREQTNRLRSIVYQTQLFRRENNSLRTEAAVLRQRLWDIRQVLAVRQLQQLLNPMPMQNNNLTL